MKSRTVWMWVHLVVVAVFVHSFCQVAIDIVLHNWYHYWYDLIAFGVGAVYAGTSFFRLWTTKQ